MVKRIPMLCTMPVIMPNPPDAPVAMTGFPSLKIMVGERELLRLLPGAIELGWPGTG